MEWSQEKVLTLIELYRERPVLWDSGNKNYKNRNKRNDALAEISFALDAQKDEIGRKIKNLQSHFSRELKRERDSQRSGAETDAVYRSNWLAYQAMQFLRDKNKPNATTNTENMVMVDTSVASEEIEIENDAGRKDIANAENTSTGNVILENLKEKPAVPEKKIHTRKRKPDTQVSEAYSIMKEVYAQRQGRDLFSVFGEQVGMRVRNLSNEHAKIYVPHLINTILFEAELGIYNNPDANTTLPRAINSSATQFGRPHHLQPVAYQYQHPQSQPFDHGSQQRVYTPFGQSSSFNVTQPPASSYYIPLGPLSSGSSVSQPPTPYPNGFYTYIPTFAFVTIQYAAITDAKSSRISIIYD